MKRVGLGWSLLVAGAACGCGAATGFGSGFAEGWLWDRGAAAKSVMQRLVGKSGPVEVSAAVGVTGHGLVGRRLPNGPLWTYEGEVDVLPSLVGDVVGFSGGDKVTLLDVSTGKVRFTIESGGRRLEGMGYDGQSSVLLLVDKNDARPDQVAVVGEHGQLRFSATTLEHIGTPAAVAGLGFVPWSHQYVSIFDLATGENLGRILVRDSVNRAEIHEKSLLFFGQGVLPLSTALAENPGLPSLRLPKLQLPGEPRWPVDGSKPRPARAQSVGLYAHPTGSGPHLSLSTGAFASTYFEIALGMEASGAAVRWATHFERSIVGADAGADALDVCLEDGSLWQVGMKGGSKSPSGSLETRLRACVLRGPAHGGERGTPLGIEAQILETVNETGPDMAAMHALLVDDLSRRSGEASTAALLAIAQNPLSSTPVVDRASRALASRTQGAEALIRSLEESAPELPQPTPPLDPPSVGPAGKADRGKLPAVKPPTAQQPAAQQPTTQQPTATPLGDKPTEPPVVRPPALESYAERRQTKRSPPIIALAQALTAMGDKRAATPLARHLLAPALSAEQATALLDALDALGGAEQCALMLEFFGAYRAAGGEREFVTALARAGAFVDKKGTPEQRAIVLKAASDSLTHPDLRKKLAELLANKTEK